MGEKYLIGIDGGSQSSKVVIFDLAGTVICEGRQELRPMHLAEPGIAEHPDDDLWDSIVVACRQAMDGFPGDPRDILGIGVCSIRCCRVLMKADGSLAQPAISWMDRRLARPYEHDNPDVRYVAATTGYVGHRFAGTRVDTAANYEGEWPLDRHTWQWSEDPAVLAQYNVPRDMLFDLVMPASIAGHVTPEAAAATGIPAGVPVVTTANDKAVEALGCGLMTDDAVLISLGTYICGMAKGHRYITDAANFWTNLACVPNEYLYESGGIRRGMWTISWFRGLFEDGFVNGATGNTLSPEEILEKEAAATPAGADGLMTVLDWLAPPDELYRKGIFIGFDGRHGRGHMYRSILEAIALTMKGHVDGMVGELGMAPNKVIVSGGGSNSDLFMQIFADVFGLPAERTVVNGAAGLGGAICAAYATGAYPDLATAAARMVRNGDRFTPVEKNTRLYGRLYSEAYSRIRADVAPTLKKTFDIFG